MTRSLRSRILLTLVPLVALFLVLGGTGVVLLYRLGGNTDAILRENYDSVVFMERLGDAVERIDSSFQFALAGREEKARQQFDRNWQPYLESLRQEQNNITLPGEREEVERLTVLTEHYRRVGDQFFARPAQDAQRERDYFATGGLLDTFTGIKEASARILHMNQDNMERVSRNARATARASVIGFGIGLAVATLLAVALAWSTSRSILRPIRFLTQSAWAIGRGDLNQIVPVWSRDELGLLAEAFNAMARQLNLYRQSDYAKLLRAQRTSQATIDSFPDPVFVLDEEGRVEMANPAAERILGLARRKAESQPGLKWEPPEPLQEPLRAALRHQEAYLPEGFDRAVPLRVNGHDHFFLPRCLPIADPYKNTLGAAVLLADVTRFRLLDQVKSDLVATVSHELKTPLTSIRLALHLLLEEAVGPLSAKQTELIADAREDAERLLDMVNNLLDLARLEQGAENLDLRPERPGDLLRSAAEAAAPRAEGKGVAILVEAPDELPPVAADARRLSHALGNLIDNALTYTDRGGQVRLTAAASSDSVTLNVADSGRGIPPEHRPRIFEKFFRVPGRSTEKGTGLGLAIVREIVQAHGGSITCESEPGKGTVFHLKLPVWTGNLGL